VTGAEGDVGYTIGKWGEKIKSKFRDPKYRGKVVGSEHLAMLSIPPSTTVDRKLPSTVV
jgi:hypothetical protein